LPSAVVVELDAAEMRSTTFYEGLAPGYIIIPPEEGQRTWRRTIATEVTTSGRAALQAEMLRRQIPLAPRVVNTHFGLQGQTARKGMLAYCQKPKGMSDGDTFLAIYVLLSRATKLDDLLVAHARAQALTIAVRERPPVAIMDLGLPPDPDGVSEGFATLAGLARQSPETKVIVAKREILVLVEILVNKVLQVIAAKRAIKVIPENKDLLDAKVLVEILEKSVLLETSDLLVIWDPPVKKEILEKSVLQEK
jgi:hypothetical protein